MKTRSATAAMVLAFVLVLTGCIWAPDGQDDDPPLSQGERSEPRESDAPDSVDAAVLEPPLTQDELEPLLAQAYEGLFEGLVVLRRGDIDVEVLFDYATTDLIEQQLRVFGSSIPADYEIDGFFAVAGVEVPSAWEGGAVVTAHLCTDDSDVRILDAEGNAIDHEPTSRYSASTVLFELSEDRAKFLVADILSLFPDAPDPCPAA